MKAIILAAGVGQRLYGDDHNQPPKVLLRFDGKTLLERHIENLRDNGIDELVLVVGYRGDEILGEARAVAGNNYVRGIFNPHFLKGSIVSLWSAREVLRCGDDVLFMDADVLYHPALIRRLIASSHKNCFLLDREIENGEEPVKLCIRDGKPVDFGKNVTGDFDFLGEWPGFLRMSPVIGDRLAAATESFIKQARTELIYEEAMRKVLVSETLGTFGYEDISDLPWIEIDFPADLMRAQKHIFPRISLAIGMDDGDGDEDEHEDEDEDVVETV
jgi:choline kinase